MVKYRGYVLPVYYVSRDVLAPAFGLAKGGVGKKECVAYVRNDLSPRVQRFVKMHEVYHLVDTRRWWGALGRELRANFVPGWNDPFGLVACIWATLTSCERMRFYFHRLWFGY